MATVKRTGLTMQQRLDILKELEISNVEAVANKYNIHRTTVIRIRQKMSEINTFEPLDSKIRQRQRLRKPMNEELENCLLKWYLERRTAGAFISDALLLQKAVQLKEECGASSNFKASRGWLSKFKQRNNIRLVRPYNEKSNVDADGARRFVDEFNNFMEEEEIDPENVYNMDETGLLWRALPVRTSVGETEKSVSGHKMKKDRLALGLCVNSTGTHKIMPLLIYKYKRPRALGNNMDRLPVVFRPLANTWMSQTLFIDWFDNCFKKSVQQRQLETRLWGKVVLLLDNCARYKFPLNYVQHENFIIKYLPTNTTSLIQPMDQGIIKKFKTSFRHKMAQRLLLNKGDVKNFYEDYTLQHCINMIDEAWRELTSSNIKNAWNKIIPQIESREENEEEEERENVVQEMEQIFLKHDITREEIEEYFDVCKTEENSRNSETSNGTVEDRREETVENKESDEEMDEGRDEYRNECDETLQRRISLSTEEREKLEDIFKYLESFKNRVSPSTVFHIEGVKMTFLNE